MTAFGINAVDYGIYWGVDNIILTDMLWFKNMQLNYPMVSGSCTNDLKGGLSCFDADLTALNSNWYAGNIILTDGIWFKNTQLDYLVVGGRCDNGLRGGSFCFDVSGTASTSGWNIGTYNRWISL